LLNLQVMNNCYKILITGGPGSGKTSIINELQNKNYNCEHEIVRSLTLEGKENGIDQLFLKNPLIFSEKLLELRINQFNKKQSQLHTFYDRGAHDALAYLNYMKIKYPKVLITKVNKVKYDKVIVLPPWKDIYIQDDVRYESFEESINIYNEIIKIYDYFKMNPIILNKGTVNTRIENILEIINKYE
jgi:predicted ATPase